MLHRIAWHARRLSERSIGCANVYVSSDDNIKILLMPTCISPLPLALRVMCQCLLSEVVPDLVRLLGDVLAGFETAELK